MMKRILFLLAAVLLSGSSFGQPAGTMFEPSFPTCRPTLLQTGGDATQNLFGTDSHYPTYVKTVQMFDIGSTAKFNIVGVVVWIGCLDIKGSPGTITFDVMDFDGYTGMTLASSKIYTVPNQDCPGYTLGTPTVKSTSDLHASNCLDDANVITFNPPVLVDNSKGGLWANKIGIGIDAGNIGANNSIGMFSTGTSEGTIGPGNVKKEFAWQYETSTDAWYTILYSTNGFVNADMLVFPILDMNAYNAGPETYVCNGFNPTGIVEAHNFFNGMKLSQSYPNPTGDKCLIEYELEKESKVTLSIYDMSGQRIKFFDEGNKPAGSYSLNLDMKDLASGNYIYSLSSDGKLLTKMMTLQKIE
jgi:hypothetical protein